MPWRVAMDRPLLCRANRSAVSLAEPIVGLIVVDVTMLSARSLTASPPTDNLT
jgi:hypothetical protein